MRECMTVRLLEDFSGCLVDNPSCRFAERFGFSHLCHHPKHEEFSQGAVTPEERERRNQLYLDLRDMRRDQYILKYGQSPEEMVARLKVRESDRTEAEAQFG